MNHKKVRSQKSKTPLVHSLEVAIPQFSERLLPEIGVGSGFPLILIRIGISGAVNPRTGLFKLTTFDLVDLYNRKVGRKLNNKTLVGPNTKIRRKTSLPILRLPFQPSVLNISKFVFLKLNPILNRKELTLEFVTATFTDGTGVTKRKDFRK
ncbi:hypothetical protein [Marininema halotolerans]|uniref:Uncharacterized protein n=1 Tax=Marininema halotolerans TaxID=1155944 RepID=A0A1I6NUL5_9BACL|nr:hypothetical protein [Marininema halotolerans]SFS31621.1 hypothetical protein SAMN05444972_101147 [Marininema halotolerans]